MKIIRKGRKVRSFGRADTKIKTWVPISQPRTKSGSEFFSLDDEIRPESIELYSRGAFPSESPSRGLANINSFTVFNLINYNVGRGYSVHGASRFFVAK